MSSANQQNKRFLRNFISFGLLGVMAAGFTWACVSSNSDNKGAGGSASNVGGNASAGGNSSAGGNTGAGGSTSTNTGGSNSIGGATGAPGAVACAKPTAALITDFTYTSVDGGSTTKLTFGNSTTLSGGTYFYPDPAASPAPTYPLTSNIAASNWHISGTVGTYSGFGLYFDNCTLIDASAYKGISFTISGTVGTTNTVTLGVSTAADTIASAWDVKYDAGTQPPTPNFGRCNPPTSNQYDGSCADPQKAIPVTATPTTVTVLWADLVGGKPQASVTPSEVTGIYFFFSNPASGTTYAEDIVIDNLSFVP